MAKGKGKKGSSKKAKQPFLCATTRSKAVQCRDHNDDDAISESSTDTEQELQVRLQCTNLTDILDHALGGSLRVHRTFW